MRWSRWGSELVNEMAVTKFLRACLEDRPVRAPGLQDSRILPNSCRPRALTRRLFASSKHALKLSRAEKVLLLQAAAWLMWIRLLLALFAYRRVTALVRRWARPVRNPWALTCGPLPAPEVVGRLVAAAANRIPGTTCLPRALATQVLLCRRGHAAQLRLGVNRDPKDRFEAHAWVETHGRVVIGDVGLDRYEPLGKAAALSAKAPYVAARAGSPTW